MAFPGKLHRSLITSHGDRRRKLPRLLIPSLSTFPIGDYNGDLLLLFIHSNTTDVRKHCLSSCGCTYCILHGEAWSSYYDTLLEKFNA